MNRLTLSAVFLFLVPAVTRAGEPNVYKVGIPKSAFRDLPPALVAVAGASEGAAPAPTPEPAPPTH